MINRVLITGASGFIGGHLVAALVEDGYQVSVISRRPEALGFPGLVEVYPCDGKYESILYAVEQSNPDTIIHLASLFLSTHNIDQMSELVSSNILFGTYLLEAAGSLGVKRFINTGTSWQYDANGQQVPVNLYASTKSAFENILKYYSDISGMDYCNLMLFDTYGPEDKRKKLLALLLDSIESGESLALSPGEQQINLVHVSDVVNAFSMCLRSMLTGQKYEGQTFRVDSDSPFSIKELVEEIELALECKILVRWGEREYRDREVMVPTSFGSRIEGWSPQINISQGVKSLLGRDEKN